MLRLAVLVVMTAAISAAESTSSITEGRGPEPKSLTLRAAIVLSAGSSGVKLSSADRLGSAAQVTMARAELLPRLWAEGILKRGTDVILGEGQPDDPAPGTTFDGRLRLSQALIDLSAWYRYDGAKENDLSFMARGQAALEIAAAAAAEAYVDLILARQLEEARKSDLAMARELLILAQAQVRAGLAENLAVARAETQAAVAEGDLLVQENRAARAEITLARALSFEPTTKIITTSELGPDLCRFTGLKMDKFEAVVRALKDRPELRSEDAAVLAAQVAARAIRAGYTGRLELFADGGRIGPSWTTTVTTWTIGVQYTLPIFDGLRRAGQIDEQEAKAIRTRLTGADLRQQIEAEVHEAQIDLASAEQLVVTMTRRFELAGKELEEARGRFAGGLTSNSDVISAQQGLTKATSESLAARAGAAVARARYARSVGSATAIE